MVTDLPKISVDFTPVIFLEELIELSSDLMAALDPSGRVVHANGAFLKLLGCSDGEVSGQSLVHFVIADDRQMLSEALARLISSGGSERLELRCMAQDGEPVRCDYTLRLSNKGPHILAIGRNLETKCLRCNLTCMGDQTLERLIEERTRELQLANAEMESFSFSISHDLRAPLRAIRGFAKAVAEDHDHMLGVTGRDYLRRILSNCDRMTTLTDYLLDLARMSRQELQFTTVDMGQMADTIIEDLHAVDSGRIVSFSRKGNMVVEGDRELLFTLLQNLLCNAWKYTAKRHRANIVFSSQEVSGETIFSIVDNGVGYPVALQERLFFLFQRLHDPNEYEGFGIGLPEAQRIVRRHGGRIWSDCVEGERTAFHFTLKNRL